MGFKKLLAVLSVCTSVLVLSGCQITKPKTAAVAPPPPPPQKLIVHNLSTQVGKRQIVAAEVDFSNDTGRSLDYVMFKTRAFDHNGKEIPAMKSGQPNAWLRIAGPISHGHRTGGQRWDKVWANSNISCFRIEGAEVIYEDSSVEFYEMDQIEMDLAALPPAVCQPIDKRVAATQ